MIQLYVNNVQVDIGDAYQLSFNYALNDSDNLSAFTTIYSSTIDLPMSRVNRRVFNFPEIAISSTDEYTYSLRRDSSIFDEGTLIVSSVDTQIHCNLFSSLVAISSTLAELESMLECIVDDKLLDSNGNEVDATIGYYFRTGLLQVASNNSLVIKYSDRDTTNLVHFFPANIGKPSDFDCEHVYDITSHETADIAASTVWKRYGQFRCYQLTPCTPTLVLLRNICRYINETTSYNITLSSQVISMLTNIFYTLPTLRTFEDRSAFSMAQFFSLLSNPWDVVLSICKKFNIRIARSSATEFQFVTFHEYYDSNIIYLDKKIDRSTLINYPYPFESKYITFEDTPVESAWLTKYKDDTDKCYGYAKAQTNYPEQSIESWFKNPINYVCSTPVSYRYSANDPLVKRFMVQACDNDNEEVEISGALVYVNSAVTENIIVYDDDTTLEDQCYLVGGGTVFTCTPLMTTIYDEVEAAWIEQLMYTGQNTHYFPDGVIIKDNINVNFADVLDSMNSKNVQVDVDLNHIGIPMYTIPQHIFHFDNAYWVVSKIESYAPESYEMCPVTFTKVNNLGSYIATSMNLRIRVSNGKINGQTEINADYPFGTSVQLYVTPDSGYRFSAWSDGNTSNPRTFLMTRNISVDASCVAAQSYEVRVTASHCTVTGGGSHVAGSTVTLVATPEASYTMTATSWSFAGAIVVTYSADYKTATFTMPSYILYATVSAVSAQQYTLTFANDGYCVCSPNTFTGYPNDQVTVTVGSFTTGRVFSQWNDGDTNNPRTFTVGSSGVTYTASTISGTTHKVEVTATYCSVSGTGNYEEGATVTLTATPNTHYRMTSSSWSNLPTGATVSEDYTTVTFTMPSSDVSITATATLSPLYNLTFANDGYCACNPASFQGRTGDQVTVTVGDFATGKEFASWADGSTDNPRTFTVGTLAATYTAQTRDSAGAWLSALKYNVDNSMLDFDEETNTYTLYLYEHNSEVPFYPLYQSGLSFSNIVITLVTQIQDAQGNAATSVEQSPVYGTFIAKNIGHYDYTNDATAVYTLSYPGESTIFTLNVSLVTEDNVSMDVVATDEGNIASPHTFFGVQYGLIKTSTSAGNKSTVVEVDSDGETKTITYWSLSGDTDYSITTFVGWTINDVVATGETIAPYYTTPLGSAVSPLEALIETDQDWIHINSVDSNVNYTNVEITVDANDTGLARYGFVKWVLTNYNEIECFYIIYQDAE